MSELNSLIEKLSKSSPNAVYTPKTNLDYNSNNIYNYLYIETDIEKDYKILLSKLRDFKNIIFLCGSSGDGKSAIIGRNKTFFEKYYDVHIDATHSFRPDQTAIEALDDVFTRYKKNNKSLVVGINMGILLNYAREGSNDHVDIKNAIDRYDKEDKDSSNIKFINFENYPKFEIDNDEITSHFIHQLLEVITQDSEENPFYKAYREDLKNNHFTIGHQNFYLLTQKPIQKSIVQLLVTVHLKYDQFLTARGILDLIHILLKGPRLLIDQLFESDSNSILENTRKEDPILYRTKQLDTFLLERSNNKVDNALNDFINKFNEPCKQALLSADQPHTLIRTFFLYKDDECSTNYHKNFSQSFTDTSTLEYVQLILALNDYKDENRSIIREFYKKITQAIFAYANKEYPSLTAQGLFQFDMINGYHICAPLELSADWNKIQNNHLKTINNFECYLKVDDHSIAPIVITLSMYKMLIAINKGYRPNKHDRNTIILFEELLANISQKVKMSKNIHFIKERKTYTFKNRNEEIEVAINAD